MKKFLVLLALVSSFAASSFADIPPPRGTKSTAEITGTAASILYSSIGGEEIAFSKNIGELVVERLESPIKKGRVRVTGTATSDTEIACATYYSRGRGAICKLIETSK